MIKTIIITMLVAAISCRPQFRPTKHFSLGPGPRQPHFLNAAPAPQQNFEPQEVAPPSHRPFPIAQLPADRRLPQLPLSDRRLPQLPPSAESKVEPSEYEQYQNNNAKYQFSSNVEDHINDQSQHREETRDGASVMGMYSYSDGYFKRTVHYTADENGYRVTGMEATPLDGPHVDLSGSASVSNNAHGTQLKYKVVSVPVEGPVGKVVDPNQ